MVSLDDIQEPVRPVRFKRFKVPSVTFLVNLVTSVFAEKKTDASLFVSFFKNDRRDNQIYLYGSLPNRNDTIQPLVHDDMWMNQ
jgi:hypothetical protein